MKGMTPMIVRFEPEPEKLRSLNIGPLGPHIEHFAAVISRQGYCKDNGWQKVRLVADLSRWLEQRGVTLRQLDEQQIAAFFQGRRNRGSRHSGDPATMTLLLRHLRQSHVIPVPPPPAVLTDIELIERDYGTFLRQERSFMPASVGQYLPRVRRFLSHRFPSGRVRLKKLSAKDVTDFILEDTENRCRRSVQLMAAVLRSFLSFLFQHGRTQTNLAAAVPTVAAGRLSELPRYLESDQVEKILESCDRRCKVGKRDYAILLLLARLGLRAGEVAYLTLDDVDWRAGELLIRGKGARIDRLPLLEDVGKALVDYLRKGRPDCSSRRVFIQKHAPYEGFASSASIDNVVRAGLARAQIHSRHQGAHLLRHSLATRMLSHGASLPQIGQVLRHQLTQTTEIYAKVDFNALRALALSWPGGVR
jgi:site-specific recombinase XerD